MLLRLQNRTRLGGVVGVAEVVDEVARRTLSAEKVNIRLEKVVGVGGGGMKRQRRCEGRPRKEDGSRSGPNPRGRRTHKVFQKLGKDSKTTKTEAVFFLLKKRYHKDTSIAGSRIRVSPGISSTHLIAEIWVKHSSYVVLPYKNRCATKGSATVSNGLGEFG